MSIIGAIAVELAAMAALVLTIRQRKKMELPVLLYLAAFEIMVIFAAGWMITLYGSILEMGNI